jgi:RNA polymerase sigma-70 factor (ECF subfamily)
MLTGKTFEDFFEKYVDDLSCFLAYYTPCPNQLEDWVQEVFLKVWKLRHRIDPEHPGVKSYLIKIARNHALKKLRDQKKYDQWLQEHILSLTTSYPPQEPVLNPPDFEGAYRSALTKIPNRARQAYMLSREDGLKYKEIAKTMGISPKTVEAQISHALNILRTELKHFREL